MIRTLISLGSALTLAVLPVTAGSDMSQRVGEDAIPLPQAVLVTAEVVEFEPNQAGYRRDQSDPIVEAAVHTYFADVPAMARVSWCESRWRQWETDGSVLRGRLTPADVGAFQINEGYHLATAQSMGINVHTLRGNMEYARHLYVTQGLQPWSASKYCWNS